MAKMFEAVPKADLYQLPLDTFVGRYQYVGGAQNFHDHRISVNLTYEHTYAKLQTIG